VRNKCYVGELTCGMAGGVLPGDNYLVARRPDAASRTWRTATPSCPSSLTLRTRRTCCRRNKRKGPPRRERRKRSKSCVRPSVRRLLRCPQRASVRGTHARTGAPIINARASARASRGFLASPHRRPSPRSSPRRPWRAAAAPSFPPSHLARCSALLLALALALPACLGGPAGAPKQGT